MREPSWSPDLPGKPILPSQRGRDGITGSCGVREPAYPGFPGITAPSRRPAPPPRLRSILLNSRGRLGRGSKGSRGSALAALPFQPCSRAFLACCSGNRCSVWERCRDAPGCTGMSWDAPGCAGIHRDAPGCTGIHRDVPAGAQGYPGMGKAVQGQGSWKGLGVPPGSSSSSIPSPIPPFRACGRPAPAACPWDVALSPRHGNPAG